MNAAKLKDAPPNVFFGGKFAESCCAFCLAQFVGCHCLLMLPMRQHVRHKYGLQAPENHVVEDFLCTWCCGCCTLIQEYNEITLREGVPQGGVMTDVRTVMDSAKQTARDMKQNLDNKRQEHNANKATASQGDVQQLKDAAREVTVAAHQADRALDKAEKATL